jgi:hypothetical protein
MHRLFELPALELCARSVAASTGDLRHALKACRAAVDELERQQHQQAAAAAAAAAASLVCPTVSMKTMMGALSKIAGVRSSQFGVQATSSIRSLPNQQQLLLYALSVLCSPGNRGCSANSGAACLNSIPAETSSLWSNAGSAVALSSSPGSISSSGRKGGKGSSKLSRSSLGNDAPQPSQQVFVLASGLEEVYVQYRHVCKLLALPACSKPEVLHIAELLSQAALVDVIRLAAGPSCPGGGGGGGSAGLCGGSGVLGSRKGRGLGGLGKSLLAGGGGCGGRSRGGSQQQQQQRQGEVKLCLRASGEEVLAALKHNPALRCLVEQ